jgi:putative Mg2+ transporter-C (MgtC) family protein
MHELYLAQGVFFGRLAIALTLGLMIGFERQWRQRTAGLHTSTLVALGAALFTMVPSLLGSNDIMRVAAQIISGIGFLAGGVILRDGFNVRGLITAATLWATAAVGVLVGSGLVVEAVVGAAVIALVNLVCVPLAELITRIPRGTARHETTYTLNVTCSEGLGSIVRERILRQIASTTLTLVMMSSSVPHEGAVDVVAEMTKPGRDDGSADKLQAAIFKLGDITTVNYGLVERTV